MILPRVTGDVDECQKTLHRLLIVEFVSQPQHETSSDSEIHLTSDIIDSETSQENDRVVCHYF